MPAPLIPIIAGAARAVAPLIFSGTAGRATAGTAGRAVIGQAAKTAGQNGTLLPSLTGRTASGKTLQATKPKKQWDWSDMASNFSPNDGT